MELTMNHSNITGKNNINGCMNFKITNFSAIAFTKNHKTIYTCTNVGNYGITEYTLNPDTKTWLKVDDLPRAEVDDTEIVLQLKLDKDDHVLFGIFSKTIFITFNILLIHLL